MPSPEVFCQLEANASAAEQKLEALRTQLEALYNEKVSALCAQEVERLRKENICLRDEVIVLKTKLCHLETANGVKQVPIPSTSTTQKKISAPDVSKSSPIPVGSTATESPVGSKASKAEKKAKKSEPKAKSAKAENAAEPAVDVSRLCMKVGRIVDVKKHPDADSLYVEEVDVGEPANRTVVSGLVKHLTLEQMQNRVAVFMCNLKPAKMRGILSQGMIMCASTPDQVEVLIPPEGSAPGDRVHFENYKGSPDEQLNPKKKIWESVAPDLKVDPDGVATYKGDPMRVEGRGIVKAPSLVNVQIK